MPSIERNFPTTSPDDVDRYRRRSFSGSGIISEGWRSVDTLRRTMNRMKPSTDEVAKQYFEHAGQSQHMAYLAESLLKGLNAIPSNPIAIPLETYDVVGQAMMIEDNGHSLDIGERNAAISQGVMTANKRFLKELETQLGMLDRHPKALFLMSKRAMQSDEGEVWGTIATKIDGVVCDYFYPSYSDQPSRMVIINPLS